ncbi:MAG: hypothetical protein WC555_14330, partial [Brevundimonas sp.]
MRPSHETQTEKSRDETTPAPRRRVWVRAWAPAVALSLSAHLVLFTLLISAPAPPLTILSPEAPPRAVIVTLTRPPPPPIPPPAPIVAEPPPGPA